MAPKSLLMMAPKSLLMTAPKSSLKTAPKSLADYGFTPLSSALAKTPSQMNLAASVTPSPTGLEEQFQPLQFGSRVPGSSSVHPRTNANASGSAKYVTRCVTRRLPWLALPIKGPNVCSVARQRV
jgi:hypothetical protein